MVHSYLFTSTSGYYLGKLYKTRTELAYSVMGLYDQCMNRIVADDLGDL